MLGQLLLSLEDTWEGLVTATPVLPDRAQPSSAGVPVSPGASVSTLVSLSSFVYCLPPV